MIRRQEIPVTSPSRAAALRSTALATSLVLTVGLSVWAADAWPKPKVPLPEPRPIARHVAPNTAAKNTVSGPKTAARDTAATAPAAAVLTPATRQHAAVPPPARKPATPAAVAATSSTSRADTDALGNVIARVRQHHPVAPTPAGAGV